MSKRFKSQDYFRYPRLGTKWRRPKGRQSKLRKGKGGSGLRVAIGYRTRLEDRNKINGLSYTVVSSLKDMDGAKEAIIISSSVGSRKTKMIAERAKQLDLKVINMGKVRKVDRIEKGIAGKKKKKAAEKKKGHKAAEKKVEVKKEERKEEKTAEARKEERPGEGERGEQ